MKILSIKKYTERINNRIVVDYKDTEELFLLGIIETESAVELSYEAIKPFTVFTGCPVVKRYDGLKDFESIKALNIDNAEGFVIKFADNLRMKIKFDDYVALHRIMTNCSSYDVWENLMKFDKLPEELLAKVPDEFYTWMKNLENTLRSQYKELEYKYNCIFIDICNKIPEWNKKEFALEAVKSKHSGILFSMYNKKEYREALWKMIKPPYEKPFANKE